MSRKINSLEAFNKFVRSTKFRYQWIQFLGYLIVRFLGFDYIFIWESGDFITMLPSILDNFELQKTLENLKDKQNVN